MFMSAEDTDEVEAGDPAGMVQDHGLGPRLGHYHALLNARADALPRIQGLPGNVADASFTCLYKMTYWTYLTVLQAKKQDKALS